MRLDSYLARLEDMLRSRRYVTFERLYVLPGKVSAVFQATIRYPDGSQLSITERLHWVGFKDVKRTFYKFHYQQTDSTLIFRYDSAPHYPDLSTFPHHKHTPAGVFEAESPDLADVLREIDGILYASL